MATSGAKKRPEPAAVDLTEDQDAASETSAASSGVSIIDSSTTPRGFQPRPDFNTLLMPHLAQAARLQKQRSPLQSGASGTVSVGTSGDDAKHDTGGREVIELELSDDEQEGSTTEPAKHMEVEAPEEWNEQPPDLSLSQADTEAGSTTDIIDMSVDVEDEEHIRDEEEGHEEDAGKPDEDTSAGLATGAAPQHGGPLTPVSPPGSPPASPARSQGKRKLEETGQEDEEVEKPKKLKKKKKKKMHDNKGKGRLAKSAGQQGTMGGSSSEAGGHMEGQGAGYLGVDVNGNGEQGNELVRAMAALSAAQHLLGAALRKEEGGLQARVEQLEAEGREKDEELRDKDDEVARITSELFGCRTQNNESKQILIRLTKDVEGLKDLVPVYEYGYLQEREVAAVLKRCPLKKFSAQAIGDIWIQVDTEYVRNVQFDPFERREGKVLGIREDCKEKDSVKDRWGQEMWELIISKKKELEERCPSGSYPVECLGVKDEDTSLSEAVDRVGDYLKHVEADRKTLKDKITQLEKENAKLKQKLEREKGQDGKGGTIKVPQALRSTATTARSRSTPGAST